MLTKYCKDNIYHMKLCKLLRIKSTYTHTVSWAKLLSQKFTKGLKKWKCAQAQ